MGNSLQEQLLKAGLTNKTKASKAKKQQSKNVKQQRSKKGVAISDAEKQRRQELADRKARDKELNQQRNDARKARDIANQIKQLVETHRYKRSSSEDDIPFHFTNKGKVKKLYVSEDVHKMITNGKLLIVNCNGIFDLVAQDIAEKIRQRNPSMVIDLPKEQKPEEDEYAAYEVPDDLIW